MLIELVTLLSISSRAYLIESDFPLLIEIPKSFEISSYFWLLTSFMCKDFWNLDNNFGVSRIYHYIHRICFDHTFGSIFLHKILGFSEVFGTNLENHHNNLYNLHNLHHLHWHITYYSCYLWSWGSPMFIVDKSNSLFIVWDGYFWVILLYSKKNQKMCCFSTVSTECYCDRTCPIL